MKCKYKNCTDVGFNYKNHSSLGKEYIAHSKYCRYHKYLLFTNRRPEDRYVTPEGYVISINPEDKKKGLEHRYIMEKKLGRKLKVGETVHHKNGIRSDNRPENLELWVGSIRFGQRATDIICPHCNKPYERNEKKLD